MDVVEGVQGGGRVGSFAIARLDGLCLAQSLRSHQSSHYRPISGWTRVSNCGLRREVSKKLLGFDGTCTIHEDM